MSFCIIPPICLFWNQNMSPKITFAITGSTGHIATAVIPLLLSKGYRLRALVNQKEPVFDSSVIEVVKGSLFDIDSLNNLVRGATVVIHSAARISLNSNSDPSVYETNVRGTENVFRVSKQAGVKRFIHLSSIHAYNQVTADKVLNEESQYCSNKAARYDQSKRDAQQYVLRNSADQMEVVVLNPTAVIGPFDNRPSQLGKAIMDIYTGKVPMLISGGFDFCDVRDVATGIVNAIDRGRNGQSYLLGGKWYSLDDLQKIILNIQGAQGRLPVLPSWTGYAGLPFTLLLAAIKKQEPLYTKESIHTLVHGNKHISSLKAEKELGYCCRPLQETISDTISWFKHSGTH
jgi:dihydroflavonol-4-reductase